MRSRRLTALRSGGANKSLTWLAPIGMFQTDATGRVTYVNECCVKISGLRPAQIRARGWYAAIHPADRDRVEQEWRGAAAAGREPLIDLRIIRPAGDIRSVRVRIVTVASPAGRRRGYTGTVEDVTDPVHAESRQVSHRLRLERGRRHDDRRREILSVIDGVVIGANSPTIVADAVVQQVAVLFAAIRTAIILFDGVTRSASIAAVWSSHPTRVGLGTQWPMRDDVVGADVLAGRGVVRSDLRELASRSRIDDTLFTEGVRSLIRVPLRSKAGTIGALEIASADPYVFGGEQFAVAQEVADHAAVAITSARLFEEVQVTSARLRAISKRLVEVQEIERREIARELHDEIGQELTALKMRLEFATRPSSTPNCEVLKECAQLVQDLLSRVRRLSLDLRPPLLDDFGLRKALLSYFERYSRQTNIAVKFSSTGLSDQRFALEVETAAFRIVQESLTNVARHAATDCVEVEIRAADRGISLSVIDHGRGFLVQSPMPSGAGVSGMHERTALLGGVFNLKSSQGSGTTISALIPFHAATSR
jgi:PAS domain S-box-containing protein